MQKICYLLQISEWVRDSSWTIYLLIYLFYSSLIFIWISSVLSLLLIRRHSIIYLASAKIFPYLSTAFMTYMYIPILGKCHYKL